MIRFKKLLRFTWYKVKRCARKIKRRIKKIHILVVVLIFIGVALGAAVGRYLGEKKAEDEFAKTVGKMQTEEEARVRSHNNIMFVSLGQSNLPLFFSKGWLAWRSKRETVLE